MSKHTAGPWRRVGIDAIYAENGQDVALVHGVNREVDDAEDIEMIANAHLIAAAPALLKALEDLLAPYNLFEEHQTTIDRARAVIAKAKGFAS
jgi:hypothetical protein